LEKSAKFLIADHARKDAPPGSYSWKFITDSVEHGALQVEDRYRIGPDPNQPRPVGSGGGSKRAGRVPFTHADEAALAKWVLSRPELSRKGNELYMQWEKLVCVSKTTVLINADVSCRIPGIRGNRGGTAG
jgi:hypothetical protein